MTATSTGNSRAAIRGTTRGPHRGRRGAVVALLAVVALGACSESGPKDAGTSTTTLPGAKDCSKVSSVLECAPKGTTLASYFPEKATKATGTPIKIGTINQDTGAAGAFPELTVADRVAIDFINTELNGVDGHPLELVPCDTQFSPDLSQSCAQTMVSEKVAAVVGGIDVWGTGITTLENNGIPYVGGIPVSFQSVRSPVSFQFSGGLWGAVLGHSEYAVKNLDVKKVAIIAADFAPITDAAKLGQSVLEKYGVKSTIVNVAAVNADMVQGLNTALQSDPDAIIAATADSGCKPTMLTAQQLDVQAQMMYTGACASPNIVESVNGAADDAIFNLEAELDADAPDNVFYQQVAERYGAQYAYDALTSGTVSFRAVMNLYMVMRTLGAENVTQANILEAFRSTKDEPSFWGHPYTCNGKQLDGYPAMCSPQQTLGKVKDGVITGITGWLDVGAFADGPEK